MTAIPLAKFKANEKEKPPLPKDLRDEFAMAALNGMLAHGTRYQSRNKDQHWHRAIADESYEIADAMLEAREAH